MHRYFAPSLFENPGSAPNFNSKSNPRRHDCCNDPKKIIEIKAYCFLINKYFITWSFHVKGRNTSKSFNTFRDFVGHKVFLHLHILSNYQPISCRTIKPIFLRFQYLWRVFWWQIFSISTCTFHQNIKPIFHSTKIIHWHIFLVFQYLWSILLVTEFSSTCTFCQTTNQFPVELSNLFLYDFNIGRQYFQYPLAHFIKITNFPLYYHTYFPSISIPMEYFGGHRVFPPLAHFAKLPTNFLSNYQPISLGIQYLRRVFLVTNIFNLHLLISSKYQTNFPLY